MTEAVKGQRQTRVEEKETRQKPQEANRQQQQSREEGRTLSNHSLAMLLNRVGKIFKINT